MMLYHDIHQYLCNINTEGNILIDTMLYKATKEITGNAVQDSVVNDNSSLSSVLNNYCSYM